MTDDDYKAAHALVNVHGDAVAAHVRKIGRLRKFHKGNVPAEIMAPHMAEMAALQARSKATQDIYVAEVLRRQRTGERHLPF